MMKTPHGWMTPEVKTAIKRNSRVYRNWVKRGRNPHDHDNVRDVRNSTNKFIKEAKLAYYSNLGNKHSDHSETGQQHFWSAYKKVVNKKDRNLYGYTVIIYQQNGSNKTNCS